MIQSVLARSYRQMLLEDTTIYLSTEAKAVEENQFVRQGALC